MADKMNLELAKATFDTLCRTLDSHEWRYRVKEGELALTCGAQGDDLSMELNLEVDAGRTLVLLTSHLPYVVQEDKRLDVAVAVSAINNALVDGSFDYDVASGHTFFRMTNSFMGSTLGEEYFTYLLYCSCQTIDAYNDKLLMVAKGMISLEQFLNSMKQ
jgi:hypothetical protein